MLKEIVLPPIDMKKFSDQPIDSNLIIMSHDFNVNELVIPFYETNVFDTYEAFYSFQGNTSIIIQEVYKQNNEIRIPIVNDVRRHKGIFTIELNASSASTQATLLKLNVMVKRSNIDSNSEFLFNHYYKLFEDYEKEIAELNNATQATIKTQLKQSQDNLQKVTKTLIAINDKVMVVNDTADGFMLDVAAKQADVTSKYNAFDTDITEANQTIDELLALQPQFQAVLDETTGKEVISAPEIILARNGEANLKARLDKEHQQVTAQLAHTDRELGKKPNRTETGWATLNILTEEERAKLLGLEPGEINAVLGEGNVMPFNTTFFKHGKNLFNKDVAKPGFYVNHNTGCLITNAGYTASDYMEVLPNTNYSFSFEANNRIAFYTDQKQFISGASGPAMPITTPINAKFAVISFVNDRLDVQQFELGAVNTFYEPYIGWFFDTSSLKDKSITSDKFDSLSPDVFADKTLTPSKMTFFKDSKNLYNKATSIRDRSISVASGNLATNANNITSDFIPVESGEYYSLSPYNPVIRLAFYDSYKNYVSGLSDPSNPILGPENGAYVRYSYSGDFEDVRQFEKGQIVTSYEPYYESAFDVETIDDNSIPIRKLKGGATLGGGVSDEILVDMNPTIIEFYIKGSNPDSSRYLKYSFKKEARAFDDTKSNGNLDAWRLVDLYEVERIGDFSFANVYSESLTTDGVWEFALKEKGQPQFMGGAHGNEVTTDVFMLVDGVQKMVGTSGRFTCKNIRFVQKSIIYRVFTQIPLANVVKAYDITAKDGIKITAEFDWVESIVLEGGSFFPMLPIKRTLTDNVTQITDRFVRDSDYDIKDISTTSSVVSSGAAEAISGVVESSMWGQDSGISVKIASLKKAKEEETMYIAASDLFNKFYYQIVGKSDYTVAVGEKMKSTALFKFNTIN